jgi:hypothetical protein
MTDRTGEAPDPVVRGFAVHPPSEWPTGEGRSRTHRRGGRLQPASQASHSGLLTLRGRSRSPPHSPDPQTRGSVAPARPPCGGGSDSEPRRRAREQTRRPRSGPCRLRRASPADGDDQSGGP